MAPLQFLNLLALSSLAILSCSFGASPVTALVTGDHHIRDVFPAHGHGAIAKRKRASSSNAKRCKAKPQSSSSSSTSTSTSSPTPASTPKTTPQVKAKSPPKASSSSSTAAAAYTPPSSGSGKVGIAWPNRDAESLKNFKTDKVHYVYTWGPQGPPEAEALGLTFIPMLWGDKQVADFARLVKKGYADMVFGFNEPNENGQSAMDASHGVALWKQYIQPLKYQGYKLISPATSSNPNGMLWVKKFRELCGGGCTFDGIAVHYYDVSPQGFITYIENWHNTFNLPVYPTEFACQNYNHGAQCSESEVYNFMSTVTNYMDNADWVPMYFAFGVMKDMQGVNTLNQLMDNNGQPTNLGKKYIYG